MFPPHILTCDGGNYKIWALVAIVVAIVPIALVVPPVFVLIPPAVMFAPAALASFVQIVTPAVGLMTIRAMMLDGFVQFMVGMGDARLALLLGLGLYRGRRTQQHQSGRNNEEEKALGKRADRLGSTLIHGNSSKLVFMLRRAVNIPWVFVKE